MLFWCMQAACLNVTRYSCAQGHLGMPLAGAQRAMAHGSGSFHTLIGVTTLLPRPMVKLHVHSRSGFVRQVASIAILPQRSARGQLCLGGNSSMSQARAGACMAVPPRPQLVRSVCC